MNLDQSFVVPIIMAIVELGKGLGVPQKLSALIAVIAGIVIGIFYLRPGEIKLGIFEGAIFGLSAAGLYSGTKNTVEQIKYSIKGKWKYELKNIFRIAPFEGLYIKLLNKFLQKIK